MMKKLVRDNIPALIESDGRTPVYKCIEDKGEYMQLLKCKLQKEVAGMSLEEFERLRLEKASVNGGFDKRIFLNDIIG